MHQPPSARMSIGLSDQYIEKPSQVPSSVFITLPSIIPIQHPTLSQSGLTTDTPMITTITTPKRNPT